MQYVLGGDGLATAALVDLVQADGGEDDGSWDMVAENADGKVTAASVGESPRDDPPMVERLPTRGENDRSTRQGGGHVSTPQQPTPSSPTGGQLRMQLFTDLLARSVQPAPAVAATYDHAAPVSFCLAETSSLLGSMENGGAVTMGQ